MTPFARLRFSAGSASLALAGVVALAGCGSSHSTSAADAGAHIGGSAITQAADVSDAAAGERIAYTLTEQLPSSGKLSVTGTGSFNTSPEQGQLNMHVSAPGISGLGSDASALSKLSLSLVLDNKVIYVKLPSSLSSKLSTYTDGKPWVSVNLAQLASTSSIPGLSNLLSGQTSPTNPTGSLQELQAASSTGITKVGSATVNGVATTEYKATLNLAKLSQRLPAAKRRLLTQDLASSRKLGITTIPVDVYIDSAHLIRRLILNYSITEQGASTPAVMQYNFLAYGHQPAPTDPASSDTFDLTGLLSTYLKSHAGSGSSGGTLGG